MSRSRIPDKQLRTIETANKVAISSLDIDGASDIGAALVDADLFIVDDGAGGTNRKITAARMQDYFSKLDILETTNDQTYQLLFADDNTNFVESSMSQLSANPTNSLSSSTTSLTFSSGIGGSISSGVIIGIKSSGGDVIAYTVSSPGASSGDTSIAVSYNSAASDVTSLSAGSSAPVQLTQGGGDGSVRVDGSHLTYNPSSNLLTVGGNISAGDNVLLASDGAVLSMGADADVTFTHDGSDGLDLVSAGAIDIDATGAVSIDSSATVILQGATGAGIGDDTESFAYDGSGNVDFDAVALDLDASGAIDIDGASTLSLDAADSVNLTMAANASLEKVLTIAASNSNSSNDAKIDMDADGAIEIDAGAGLSLDAGAASNLSTSAGNLTISSAATLDVDAVAIDIDGTGAMTLDTTDTSNGIKIGTGTSGVPITIGHGTSEVTVADNLTVTGNLTISGDTTTVSTTNLNVEDALIVLQAELGSSSSNPSDLGIIMERGASGDNAALIWDEGADKFLFGTTTETGADSDVTVTVGTVQVGKLEIDGTADSIDVDTDLKVIAAADIVLDPGGNNVIPGGDSEDSLGKGATSASHSAGSSASGLMSGLSSGQSFAMNASQNQAVLYGSSLSAGSGSTAPSGISASTLGSVSLSGFASSPSGTLPFSGNGGASVSAGTVMSLQDSGANKFFFVVVEDYSGSSGSSTMKIHALSNISGHSTSVSSVSDIQQHSSFSGSGLSGVSASKDQTVEYTFSGGNAVFVLAADITSSTPWGFVADPRDDLSSLSTFSSSSSPSAANAGGSVTAAASRVAWDTLFVDNVDLDGQGRIDLDDDQDTSIRSSADDQIDFEIGGSDLISMKAAGLQIVDDKKLMFGSASGGDASFEYDEDGNDVLLYAGASMRFSDDVKLEFGAGGDAAIEYDEDGTDQLRIHQPAAGVVIAGTNPKLVLGDAGEEDTMLVFDGNAEDYRIGIDDGTNVLEIGSGASHGSQIAIKIDGSENVDIASHDASSVGLKLGGTLVTTTAAELNLLDASAGSSVALHTSDAVIIGDASDSNATKKVLLSDLATLFSGAGLTQGTGAGGVLSVNEVRDSYVSGGSGGTGFSNGLVCTLSAEPVEEHGVAVYLNGVLQSPSGSLPASYMAGANAQHDYIYGGSEGSRTVTFVDALLDTDVIQVKYIAKSE